MLFDFLSKEGLVRYHQIEFSQTLSLSHRVLTDVVMNHLIHLFRCRSNPRHRSLLFRACTFSSNTYRNKSQNDPILSTICSHRCCRSELYNESSILLHLRTTRRVRGIRIRSKMLLLLRDEMNREFFFGHPP